MGDAESCNIRVLNSGWNHVNHIIKVEAYNEVVSRLKELNVPEVFLPGFEDELWMHFNRLPIRYVRYALDMKVDRAKDILMHKRLLHMAGASPFAIAPAVEVNLVQVHSASGVHCSNSLHSISQREITSQDSDIPGMRAMHEITISTNDKPKLFRQLTSLLSETGLDIQEAHAFSTLDGYSLDVFVVSGWALEETEKLKHVLTSKIHKLEHWLKESSVPIKKLEKTGINFKHENLSIGGNNAWEIDASCLRYVKKIASGSFSDVYKGTYCNQDVAIKVLKNGNLNENIQREFSREVYILRKIKHKNVIELIGACTIPSSLYIVTEYMSGGSMYDFLHIQKAVLTLSSLLKVAIDVSEGLHCLHNHGIIHRDLKSANLLMDGKGVVKIADFGVARLLDPTGIMTAETGTYRWMAPEVIEHNPYSHKADIFSFGIILWELLTGKLPYEHLSPLQAAVGVVQKGLRPEIPRDTHPKLVELLHQCWQQDPSVRPDFSEILKFLQHFRNMVEGKRKVKAKIMHEKE
ncbi:PREDICTED: serine/threonine-protein kinase STY46-like isoform X2 [Lupinus angustifolius]|uniref:serine/threonine-protein kinase STY46-like isoform X2 n=1 Tax=Lupinus angustifolius TaxID=3871 RepID=UPI00092F79FF|nr:PREDICTED: serine/threonine-protein kinase STY46-like isoform X2 [Lupinus angustifolius]